jgi:hypothetical protein
MEKKDILKYFIDYCKDDNGVFDSEMFDRLIDKGEVLTNENGEFEIPEKNIYVLASVETYLKFGEAYYYNESSWFRPNYKYQRHELKISSSVETYLKFAEAVGITLGSGNYNGSVPYKLFKDNDFLDSYIELIEDSGYFGDLEEKAEFIDRLLDKGIVEHGKLKFKDYSDAYQNLGDLDRVLDKGLVVFYDKKTNSIGISSVETYLKFAYALYNPESAY